jgi:hypothetical protein
MKNKKWIWCVGISSFVILLIPLCLGDFNEIIEIPELVLLAVFGGCFFFNITTLIYANKYKVYKKQADDLRRFILTYNKDEQTEFRDFYLKFLKIAYPDKDRGD